MFKTETPKTNKKLDAYEEEMQAKMSGGNKSGFIRSKKDSPMFTDIQVKDLKAIITEDCVNWIDADSIPYKCADAVQETFVTVRKLIDEPNEEGYNSKAVHPEEKEYSNATEFKGGSTKEGVILTGCILHNLNLQRKAKKLEPYVISDFEITSGARLKKFNKFVGANGKVCTNHEEVMHSYIDEWLSCIKEQLQVNNIMCVIGEGKCHRNKILLPEEYKSNREDLARPILLKQARQYLLDTYPSIVAEEGLEADEVVDAKGFEGYCTYLKTGKFNIIKSALDKDARATPGLLFNYTKDFHFKYPQPWLIESSSKGIGCIEMQGSDCKTTGLLHTAYQLVIGDASDHYGSRCAMPESMQYKDQFGDTSFFSMFAPMTTCKEVLEGVVKMFYTFYPQGVQYTAFDGTEIDKDTLWWLQQVFACQYMLRKGFKDKTKK